MHRNEEIGVIDSLFDRLWPIARSIAGPGIRKSLDIISEHLPLQREQVPTGTDVYGWTIPPEWHINDARLTGPDGAVYADLDETNLAVLNFSEPVDRHLSLNELRPHLHTNPDNPEAIPYATSYYNRTWGFCLPHRVYEQLPEGEYHAYIDSKFREGHLEYAHTRLPGESDREVLLSSYLCHPSMANNELSGPLVLLLLWHRLSAWDQRKYTYRFVLGPETIGSIAYLHRYGNEIRERLDAGLVMTCLGGPSDGLSYKSTRQEDALIDQTVHYLKDRVTPDVKIRPFTPTSGSDERQYCSPGFDLPVGQIARTVYLEYDEYHTSQDTKEFMGIDTLVDSADGIERILHEYESAGRYRNTQPHGEVMLDRYDLYPGVNSPETWDHSTDTRVDQRLQLDRIMTILNYSDGDHAMLEIAERLDCSPTDLNPLIRRLRDEELLVWEGA